MSFEITKLDPDQIEGNPVITTELKYTKRVDFINDNLLYKGEAVIGTLPSDSEWRIVRINISNEGDIIEEYSSSSFNQIWNNRLNLTYS